MNFNLLGQANSAESSTTAPPNHRLSLSAWLTLTQPNNYVCTRCSKAFPTSQALGGHQNAHRRELNEAHRLYMETRLAQIRRREMRAPSPKPLREVPPNDGQKSDHLVMPGAVAKPRASYHPLLLPEPGLGYGSLDEKAFMAGLKNGSHWSGPIRASHGNHNFHPYQRPVGKKVMLWGVNLCKEVARAGNAGASTSGGGKGVTEVVSKKELDLTLRL